MQGRAAAVEVITSPVTHRHVIGYQITFELEQEDGDWHYITLSQLASAFFVEDSSGRIQVDTREAITVFQHEFSGDSAEVGSASAPLLSLLYSRVSPAQLGAMTGQFRWHEYYLDPGERVYVCGGVGREIDVRGGGLYRENAYNPKLHRHHPGFLVVADCDAAGVVAALTPPTWS